MELRLSGDNERHFPARREMERVAEFRRKPPGWASGLRHLYDSVVAEPLPDSFDDLLKKLDQADGE
jgi:hypothetical protein